MTYSYYAIGAIVLTGLLSYSEHGKAKPQYTHDDLDIAKEAFGTGKKATYYSGEVLETIDVKNYTYIKMLDLSTDNELWLATGRKVIEKGAMIRFKPSTVLKDFKSPSLERTFDRIMFVSEIETARLVPKE